MIETMLRRRLSGSGGLLTYPALQAADILLYDTDEATAPWRTAVTSSPTASISAVALYVVAVAVAMIGTEPFAPLW